MSSDASQSILRMTLLACATALFMVVWTGDSSRTVGMTLAERNRQVFPAHAVARSTSPVIATKPRVQHAKVVASSVSVEAAPQVALEDSSSLQTLPSGSYRVVFEDGRVEWLTVIDRSGESKSQPDVTTMTVHGERAHLIRVSSRGGVESAVR
jgi:hypothetical protein